MNTDQKRVIIGAASGIILMLVGVTALTFLLPHPLIGDEIAARLAYALKANVFAMLPLFLMFITIGNERFFSEAIDPMRHAENRTMEINARVASNTLEQNFFFVIGTLALSTVVPFQYLQGIWACALVFVAGRLAFWYGYHKNPLYRAPGLSSVAYMNLFIILFVLYRTFLG